jgi:hypothetical protein
MTTILHKRGTGQPNPDDLKVGEIAIDTLTGTLYTKQSDGSVVEIGGSSGGGNVDVDTNIPILDSPPANPELGEQFFSSTDGYLYIWYGAEWVAIGCGSSGGEGGGEGGGNGGDGLSDPYWSSVRLQMQFDDESDPWKDDAKWTSQTPDPKNGAVTSDAEFKHGGRSLLVNPNGNEEQRVQIQGLGTDHLLDQGTVEFWMYPTSEAGNTGTSKRGIFSGYSNSSTVGSFQLFLYNKNLQLTTANVGGQTNNFTTSGGLIEQSRWYHVAIVLGSPVTGELQLYLNGVLVGAEQAGSRNDSRFIEIGGCSKSNAAFFGGYIDDVRVTHGVMRYKQDFVPPSQLPTTGTRSLLLERGADNDADLS